MPGSRLRHALLPAHTMTRQQCPIFLNSSPFLTRVAMVASSSPIPIQLVSPQPSSAQLRPSVLQANYIPRMDASCALLLQDITPPEEEELCFHLSTSCYLQLSLLHSLTSPIHYLY
ncbi:hypothetical protein V2G26_014850 [Clonostachys chloroleuca]